MKNTALINRISELTKEFFPFYNVKREIEHWHHMGFESEPPFESDEKTIIIFFKPYIEDTNNLSICYYLDFLIKELSCFFSKHFYGNEPFEKEEKGFLASPEISQIDKNAYRLFEKACKLENTVMKKWDIK